MGDPFWGFLSREIYGYVHLGVRKIPEGGEHTKWTIEGMVPPLVCLESEISISVK